MFENRPGPPAPSGDELRRFEMIMDQYRAPAIALALNVLENREDAEDACQEAFASAFFNLGTRPVPENLKAWVFTIVYRRCLDIIRKRSRSLRLFHKVRANMPPPAADPGREEAPSRETSASSIAWTAISGVLTKKEKLALTLWTNEDYSSREIATILDCSAATARVHLFRARRKIKALMEKKP